MPEKLDFALGLDIGSVNARLAVVNSRKELVHLDCERLNNGPVRAVNVLLNNLTGKIDLESISSTGVTGSGRELYDGQPGWRVFSSPYAAIAGVLWDQKDLKTIVAVGGQSSLVIGLTNGLDEPWRTARSPLCAAGSGRFIEQQAARLGISIEEFDEKALGWEKDPPRIAARCSVFAKSDLIHLQQKGTPVEAMAAGLCDAVARMVVSQWRDDFIDPICSIGGVARIKAFVRAFGKIVGKNVLVPLYPADREVIGAALLAGKSRTRPRSLFPPEEAELKIFANLPQRLTKHISTDGWRPTELGKSIREVYMGVDVGSTSTKAAVISLDGEVLAKTYLMTAGQPLEAVKQVMANLAPQVEGKVHVRGVGVTGSGRYLVGHFIGADVIKNEITAQTAAALQIDPKVDTIIELGGQDSKFVRLANGVTLDYQMNKACAAGTGSFIDELAAQLDVSTRTGEFARLAFEAATQISLGDRCAAFMSQAVTSAQHAGVEKGVIVSSLSTSLAKNYRSKVIGQRKVGERIFLTGAVFDNDAAVAAFKAGFPDKILVVPQHKEVTGAIGAALLAKETMNGTESSFKGFTQVASAGYKLRSFTCRHCENRCEISMMTVEDGRRLYYGSRCDRYDADGEHINQASVRTPFDDRKDKLFAGFKEVKEENGKYRS